MNATLEREVAALQRLSVRELRARYAELFQEPTAVGNRAWLVKRILWRIQALAEGDLSERARRRAAELARDADLRLSPPPEIARAIPALPPVPAPGHDERLPPPGSVLTRRYKGRDLQVRVLPDGFEYEGAQYASLSAVARQITSTHCNGYLFFRLTRSGDQA